MAICDINPDVFPRFFERAELPPGSIKQYTDYHEMFAEERLDVVSVATPDHLHTDPVCDASNAGVRGVICEKPLTTTIKDADRIIETIEANGTKMSVDHTRSWIPSLSRPSRRQSWDGEIGGLTRIVAHMGGRRSMLFRNGTHLIDGVCFLCQRFAGLGDRRTRAGLRRLRPGLRRQGRVRTRSMIRALRLSLSSRMGCGGS